MRDLSLLEEAPARHPARYSKQLLAHLALLVYDYRWVLDPMAGTGEALLSIRPDAWLNELEPRWAAVSKKLTPRSFVGDASDLAWSNDFFDCVVTSPTYGNRMADHHNAKDDSRRNTYRHILGQPLQENNAGAMQWGDDYRLLHHLVWRECGRVVRKGGRLILNVKDHVRKGEIQEVSRWHVDTLRNLDFDLKEWHKIETPGQRMGANGEARVAYENIFVLENRKGSRSK